MHGFGTKDIRGINSSIEPFSGLSGEIMNLEVQMRGIGDGG
jgi:hypothetical protein